MTRQRRYRPDPVGAAVWWTVHLLGGVAVIALPALVVVTGMWVLLVMWDASGVHP